MESTGCIDSKTDPGFESRATFKEILIFFSGKGAVCHHCIKYRVSNEKSKNTIYQV